MNWVGGARSRVRQQADRKKQKEFFERKRLQAKVKRVRPKSPQAGSSRVISKDLLYLQAISKIHDGGTDDLSEPLARVKKLKLTGPRAVWPERNLALPMSPISKPSALDLHDTTCDTQLSSLLTTTHGPRVSTQKLPHHTMLNSFGPPPQQKKSGFDKTREYINPPTDSTSLWTESVFPRGPPAPFGPSHVNETLGLEKKRFVGKKHDHKPTAGGPSGNVYVPDKKVRQHIEFPDRGTSRSLVAKKSYDHETPFNFGDYPLVEGNDFSGKDLPRTDTSLLDFHMSEHQSKPEHRFQAKGRDQPHKKERKQCMWHMDGVDEPGLPSGSAAEPGDKAKQCDSLHSHKEKPSTDTNSTMTSSMFDENPLSRKAAPPSCSTVFNESILGPIRRHNLGKNIPPRKSPPPEPSVTKSGYSAFERMMSTFDAFEKTLAKSVQPQPDRGEEGLADQLMSTNEGAENIGRCVTMLGNESDKGGDTRETYTDQSKKWQDFINGCTQQPQQQHKQWQKFINGELDDKPVINSDARVPDHNQQNDQEISVCKGNNASIKIERNTTGKLASISVMDELMCLEDIGSSDAVNASQEISFTPVVCSRQVPDIDTGFGVQRCMSKNPLKLNHTVTKCSPCAESEETCKEESEGMGMEQVLALCEAPVACESEDIVEPECADYGPHGNDLNCDGANTLHNKEDATCNIQSIDRQTKLECEQISSCTRCGNKDTAVARNFPPHPVSDSHLKLSCSCQLEAADVDDVIASGDPIITEHQACLIPTEFHNYVQQRPEPHREVLCMESVAVQCSMDELSPLKVNSENKSTQTHSTTYADNSVQTAVNADQYISTSEYNSKSPNKSSSLTVRETVSTVRQPNEDEQILTLRRELDSMQSTVVWQALMLRLYGMH